MQTWACDTCHDSGWLREDFPVGHPRFGKISPCPKCNTRAIDAKCGLSPKERKVRLNMLDIGEDTPGTAKMVKAAREFIREPKGFLSIHGSYGNGKSTALVSIVNACLDAGIEARYLSAIELVGWIKAGIDSAEKGDSDWSRLESLRTVPVVVMDEMDKLYETPYVRQMETHFFEARYRYADTLGTVVAWNGPWEAITLPWVASRLSMYPCVENTDPDMRPALKG